MSSYIASSSVLQARATAAVEDQVRRELDIPDPEDKAEASQIMEDARYEDADSDGEREGEGL